MKPFVLRYITGFKGVEGVYLTEGDLYTLYFVHLQREVLQTQLSRFHLLLNDISEQSFRTRIRKFEEHKIITRRNVSLSKIDKRNIIALGPKGFDILQRIGWIKADEISNSKTREQFDHAIGTKEVVLQLLEVEHKKENLFGGGEKGLLFTVYPHSRKERKTLVMNGAGHPLRFQHSDQEVRAYVNSCCLSSLSAPTCEHTFRYGDDASVNKSISLSGEVNAEHTIPSLVEIDPENPYSVIPDNRLYVLNALRDPIYLKEDKSFILIPDAALKLNHHRIHIELDTGVEKIRKGKTDDINQATSLEVKFQRYEELAKTHPNLDHHVLFVGIDNSISLERRYSKGKVRIRNLKKQIFEINQFGSVPNLHVYFINLERLKEAGQSLINNLQSSSSSLSKHTLHKLEHFVREMNAQPNYNRQSAILLWDKFITRTEIGRSLYSLDAILLSRDEEGTDFKTIIPVFMREGNMWDAEYLDYFSKESKRFRMLQDASNLMSQRIENEVWAIYETSAQMKEDILPLDLSYENILFITLEDLKTRKSPIFYQGKNRKEVSE